MQRKKMFGGKPEVETKKPSVRVSFTPDKSTGTMREMTPDQKLFTSIRKVLADMSDKDQNGDRYYIQPDGMSITDGPTGSPGPGPGSYSAKGRCKLGVVHANGTKGTIVVEFSMAYRDTVDSLGVPDVEYLPQSFIDALPRNTKI